MILWTLEREILNFEVFEGHTEIFSFLKFSVSLNFFFFFHVLLKSRHPYSLTSAPDDDNLSMHVRSLGDWSYQFYSIFQEVNLSYQCHLLFNRFLASTNCLLNELSRAAITDYESCRYQKEFNASGISLKLSSA